MKSKVHPTYEEEWKEAFAHAEVVPASSLWTSIDLQLSHDESGQMKKQVVYYQRMAAAAVIFAVGVGSFGVWYTYNAPLKSGNSIERISKDKGIQNLELDRTSIQKLNGEKKTSLLDRASAKTDGTNNIRGKTTDAINKTSSIYKRKEYPGSEKMVNPKDQMGAIFSSGLLTRYNTQASDSVFIKNRIENSKRVVSDERFMLAHNANWPVTELALSGSPIQEIAGIRNTTKKTEVMSESKMDKINEGWWASVGGSAGSYDPQTTTSPFASQAFQSQTNAALSVAPSSTRATIGTSFSFGVILGKRIAKHWLVMSGVNYMNQSIAYNSNIAVLDASNQSIAFVADLAGRSSNIATTSPYTINNINEFVSVPFQAGYLIIDRKASIQVNAGVSADLFIRSTLADASGRLSSYRDSAGDNSAFQTLNWSGVVGTELSYKVTKHYRVSLVPGFRYSFNSVLKSTTGSTLNPMVWDLGFRFRYIF